MEKGLIIFDLDGTLYQTHISSVKATQRGLAELGLPQIEEEKIISLFGEPSEIFWQEVTPGAEEDIRKQFAELLLFYEKKYIKESGKLFSGIGEMIDELIHRGHSLALVSNGGRGYIDCVLKTFDIYEKFAYIRERSPGKSKADVVKALCEETKAVWSVMVGDRKHDIEAAKHNQIPSIGVNYGYGGKEIEEADFVANHAGEILHYIDKCSIFYQLEKKYREKSSEKPYILGINGVDTSGKTQFAVAFDRYLTSRGYKTTLIHLDDFHHPSQIRSQGEDPIQSYIDYAFNLELLENELLAPIKQGEVIDKQLELLNLDTDTYTNSKTFKVSQEAIVLVEGVLLYREPIHRYFDYKVFLDIDFDEVLRRATLRDVPKYGEVFLEKYRNKYIPIQECYLEQCKPRENSDCIIDNTDFYAPRIALIK